MELSFREKNQFTIVRLRVDVCGSVDNRLENASALATRDLGLLDGSRVNIRYSSRVKTLATITDSLIAALPQPDSAKCMSSIYAMLGALSDLKVCSDRFSL